MNTENNNPQESMDHVPPVATTPPPVPPAAEPHRPGRAPWLVVLLVLCAGAAAWFYHDAWFSFSQPPAGSEPYMITEAEYEGSDLSERGAHFEARFTIDIIRKPGWKRIELLPSTVAITERELPRGTYLYLDQGHYVLLTRRHGKLEATLRFSVATTGDAGTRSVTFERVPSVTCVLKTTFPRESLDVTVDGAQSTVVTETNGITRVIAALPDCTPVKVSWTDALPEIAKGPSRFYCETRTLISVAEGFLAGQAKVDFSILHTPARTLAMKVPATASILDVTGKDIRDWRVTEGILKVQLEKEVLGPYTLNVKYEAASRDTGETLAIPVLRGENVEHEKGEIGVIALTNVELKNQETRNAHRIDVKELPPEMLGMTSQPVLLAYRYSVPDFDVSLQIGKPRDMEVLLTVIDAVHFTVLQTYDGKRITRAIYNVRNNRNQYLRLEMPEGAELWSATVAGRSTQPARDDTGRILLPLIRSHGTGGMNGFPVEIVYAEAGTAPDARGRGTARVSLPMCGEPIMHMMVSLYLPEEGKYRDFEGSLRTVESFRQSGVPEEPVPVMNQGQQQVAVFQKAMAERSPAGNPLTVTFPVTGAPVRLEKILVVRDTAWFSYTFKGLDPQT